MYLDEFLPSPSGSGLRLASRASGPFLIFRSEMLAYRDLQAAYAKSFCAVLAQVNFFHALHSIGLVGWFVWPQADYAGEAQGEAALVAVGAHDVVEGYFEDDFCFYKAGVAEVSQRVLLEPLGHLRDLDIGDSGVGFADVHQVSIFCAHRERVVAQHARTLPITELDSGYYAIQGCEFALHLQPGMAAAAGSVEGFAILNHQAFVASGSGFHEDLIDFLGRMGLA